MKVRLLVLSAVALALACEDHQTPTGPSVPVDASRAISDGAHGGNPDFFFLPPLVPNPANDPNFEQGKFNSALQPSLTVEICELQRAPVDAQGLPVATDCVAGPPVKKFPAGTVRLQNPPDGFYQVVWNTRESNLDVTRFYRIRVFVEGLAIPLGVADVDPVSNMKELRNARTGETIPLNDGSTLPINFRVEHGGGPALCGSASLCNSATITNSSPSGSQIVSVDGGAGSIAGAKFPNGWLPADGPQSVVVTISQVDLGSTNPVTGAETTPCHVGLPLQQFRGCFNFTTTPALQPIDESGRQFATPVTAAVCFVLEDSGDPRENFAELYASGPNEPPHALQDVSDVGILSPATRNCSTGTEVIGLADRTSVIRLANAGWRKIKAGVGQLFGVKTAYAVDLGLGGMLDAFSNVGPALAATIEPVGATEINLTGGGIIQPFVRIVGSNHHDGAHQNTIGIGGLPVTFTVAAGNGTLTPQGEVGGTATQLIATTNTNAIDPNNPASGGGYATVNWDVPGIAGTYTITANGPALGGPVTFTVNVQPWGFMSVGATERRMLSMQTGASIQILTDAPAVVASWTSSDPTRVAVTQTGKATAVIGGEDIAGGASATLTSVLNTGNPGPTLLADSFNFDIYPRTTTLAWNPVRGAATYYVVVDFGNGSATNPFCTVPADCGLWTQFFTATTPDLSATMSFVGQQPGRWRVFARDASGQVISTSPYVYFAYQI
jgi:hypothetical protein